MDLIASAPVTVRDRAVSVSARAVLAREIAHADQRIVNVPTRQSAVRAPNVVSTQIRHTYCTLYM